MSNEFGTKSGTTVSARQKNKTSDKKISNDPKNKTSAIIFAFLSTLVVSLGLFLVITGQQPFFTVMIGIALYSLLMFAIEKMAKQ